MTTRTKKFKFNIIDFIIIIVILACVAGLVLRSQLAEQFDDTEQKAIVTFRVSGVLTNSVEKTFIPGDEYYCDGIVAVFGTLNEGIETMDSVQVSHDENGIATQSTLPYRQDIVASMTCEGAFDEDGKFFIGGNTRITPGQSLEVFSLHRRMVLQIVAIEPAK